MNTLVVLALVCAAHLASATQFTVRNNLGQNVYVGGYGSDFTLGPGQTRTFGVPNGWSGRIYGHNGDQGNPTLAEFSINNWNGMDFYDLSIIDGYNLPLSIIPHNGGCPQVHCPYNGCPDAYHYPTDDTKTHGCRTGDFDIIFG